MQNQEKIIQAIAAYFEKEILLGCAKDTCASDYIAKQIYEAAITPHMEAGAGWEGVPSEYKYRTVDRDGMVCYWDKEPMAFGGSWVSQESPTKSMVRKTRFDWESTLERRPC